MTGGLCAVDWLAVVGVAKDVVVAIAAIVTATVACIGISKWRAEESGKADFDLARRLGTAAYRFRDAIAAGRRPFISASEFPDGMPPGSGKNEADAYAHVFNQRFQGVRQSAIDLRALRNEAEALWGKEIVGKLDALLGWGFVLHSAMSALVSDKASCGADFRSNDAFGKATRAEVFDTGNSINSDGTKGAPNEFTTKIERDVENVAAYLRTKLPRQSRHIESRR
jgi:hypothetical protein